MGQVVTIIVKSIHHAPGQYNYSWDGTDASGRLLPAGLYLIRLKAGNVDTMHKIILKR
jgi:hypothetical protein